MNRVLWGPTEIPFGCSLGVLWDRTGEDGGRIPRVKTDSWCWVEMERFSFEVAGRDLTRGRCRGCFGACWAHRMENAERPPGWWVSGTAAGTQFSPAVARSLSPRLTGSIRMRTACGSLWCVKSTTRPRVWRLSEVATLSRSMTG
jgi:hypothetical protein